MKFLSQPEKAISQNIKIYHLEKKFHFVMDMVFRQLVQLTSAYSTIFSEGVYRPLKLIKNSSQFEEERILSKENAKQIKKILYKAIKNGTGFRAKVNDHDVFGKTGTARIFKDQKYNEDLHNALFIGMTKIEDKEYLVGLFVKNPKINGDGGGDVAAPIFSEIIETIQKL